jgi:hypothetical protein
LVGQRSATEKAPQRSGAKLVRPSWACQVRSGKPMVSPPTRSVGCCVGVPNRHANCSRHQLAQEPQPLRHHLLDEKIDTCRVSIRPGKAAHKTKLDGVFADGEDDGNCSGCHLGRQRRSATSARGNHGDPSANQISGQRGQPVDLYSPPSCIESKRSRPRHIRCRSGPCEIRADGARMRQATWDRAIQSPASS